MQIDLNYLQTFILDIVPSRYCQVADIAEGPGDMVIYIGHRAVGLAMSCQRP